MCGLQCLTMSGEDVSLQHLSEHHRKQVLDYLKYFRSKRSQHIDEVDRTFDETKDTSLLEEMYTKEDVEVSAIHAE